jgi:hypothetical protein
MDYDGSFYSLSDFARQAAAIVNKKEEFPPYDESLVSPNEDVTSQ